jgi:hypothetical protein
MQLSRWRDRHPFRLIQHHLDRKLGLALLALVAATAAWAVTNSFTIVVTTDQHPGPDANIYNAQPYYTCSANRFVSTTGSAGNNGTSAGTPWDLATAVAYAAPAGTCINLATGVYTSAPTTIAHGGTSSSKTGYVVWRCSSLPFSFSSGALQGEGNGCVLRNTGTSNNVLSINGGVSYVMFDALEFDGTGATLFVCVDDENNGTGATGATTSHHIWLLNSDVHGCGQGGLQWNYTDWLFAIHNVWHDNAYSTACACDGSGLTWFEPVGLVGYTPTVGNPDYWHSATSGLTYSLVIAYNVGYHNFNLQSGTANTDGEGIILDDFQHGQNACPGQGTCPTTANTLVMGNVMYNNGGKGIQTNSTQSGSVTMVNNTTYANEWDTHSNYTFRGDMDNEGGKRTLTINNIAYTVTGAGILSNNSPFVGQAEGATAPLNNVWQTNLSFPGSINNFDGGSLNTYPTTGANKNLDGSDPKLTTLSTSTPNFALQSSSPAIGFGQAFDLWQQQGTVDAGACPFNAPGPFAHCP